jgi:DNA-binding response OmpR family regulator
MARERVLIVDDDALILRFLQVIFKDAEYRVLIARDGLEALDTVEKEMPDIVILDISMPKLDGLQVCRRLRDWSQLPIIILSARADTEG